jgi:hypothetical protein
VNLVTDQKGNRNGKDGIERHPIVVAELQAKLHGRHEAKPGDKK